MQTSLAEMKLALRVLTALTEKHHPNAADVEELRKYAPAFDGDVDTLACAVIQKAVQRRAAIRESRALEAG
jgi:hypothetical protein